MNWRHVQMILWGLFVFGFAFVSGCSAEERVTQREASTCAQADCEARHRGCVKSTGVAMCSDCQAGYVDVGGSCVAVLQCEELQCEAKGRRCVEASRNTDGTCADCMAGFVEQEGRCVAGDLLGGLFE